jgi:DNA-binding XRE family transcriptional regulator
LQINQAEAAEKAKVPLQTWGNWEREKSRPRTGPQTRNLIDGFGLRTDWLFSGTGPVFQAGKEQKGYDEE